MKTTLPVIVAALFGCALVAQDPPKQAPPQRVEQVPPQQQGKEQGKEQGKQPPVVAPVARPAPQGGAPKGTEPVPMPKSEPVKEQPLPRGTDPADIAAMRGAEKMLEAERKLARLIKEGKITGLDKVLSFDELTAWPYQDGLEGMPGSIKALAGKKVLMTGFMLPIDEVQNIKEFLLVQSLWSCCYGQPPDIHGLVRCVVPAKQRSDMVFDPIKVVGVFKVEATLIDGYCVDIFQLEVESFEVIR